ncbi:Flagellar hook-associated protein FlgL [Rhodovulum sp. P5]|uniref:flagellin n=1 Tax=Rhodovulum sp. P5 TaxID=1564506 RepID=UPI0009C22C59|nr:flagellin [Rhodovulum sp. P5]ARE40422.1 Flagellar hook-associated protein FlgL [Rhodovulum sp. P5]
MYLSTMGDLAQTMLLRSQNSGLKARLSTLSEELSTGQVADRSAHLRGDFRTIGGIERSLTLMDSYDSAVAEVGTAADVTQEVLGQLTSVAEQLAADFSLTTSAGQNTMSLAVVGQEAETMLDACIGHLNTTYGGRSLFAGQKTDTVPVDDASAILYAVKAAVSAAGANTPHDIITVVESWFNLESKVDGYLSSIPSADATDIHTSAIAAITANNAADAVDEVNSWYATARASGGVLEDTPQSNAEAILLAMTEVVSDADYTPPATAADALDTWFTDETNLDGFLTADPSVPGQPGYVGSFTATGEVRVSEHETTSLELTAADHDIRSLLSSLTIGALLADDTILTGDVVSRTQVATEVSERLFDSQYQLVELGSEVGVKQNQIETAKAANAASRNTLELAMTQLLEVDQYDTATELQAVEGQLEMLYMLTARLSQLSLANYIS